jgi:hypothetical protein
MKPVAQVLVWIALRHLTREFLLEVLAWQQQSGCYPASAAGGGSGCPVDGKGFYTGAYTPERAETFKMWLVSKGVRLT